MKLLIFGDELKNIPWEEKPEDSQEILWRSKRNPIISKDAIPLYNGIYNSAVVPFKGEFRGVFRGDDRSKHFLLHNGKSKDGIHWEIDPKPISFICDEKEIADFIQGYDPRVCRIDDRYYITWCNEYHGPTIGIAYTFDFESFYQLENAFLPFNRNGVLFPRKINGKYVMLNRPSDNGHTPFGDIFISESPDMVYWGRHRHVMSPKTHRYTWEQTKIGAGPVPIETNEGWLLIYHGVHTTCNGYVYCMGASLLDIERPWTVLYRADPYILGPEMQYECTGNVPNVVFPCAALADPESGRMAIYYGSADTHTCIAYAYVEKLIEFIKSNSTV
jgi:beta-1,4-mannooligosaccharide/beta-1,4-mannosyl-N-acetylglucosamine phosphorylase